MTDTTEPTKEEWVAALRSGKYEQGQKRLRVGDRFCCMGVLCDIDPRVEWASAYDDVMSVRLVGGARDDRGLSYPVARYSWADIPPWSQCVDWNDIRRLSFDQIADKIEAGDLS